MDRRRMNDPREEIGMWFSFNRKNSKKRDDEDRSLCADRGSRLPKRPNDSKLIF